MLCRDWGSIIWSEASNSAIALASGRMGIGCPGPATGYADCSSRWERASKSNVGRSGKHESAWPFSMRWALG